ncbi:MAG TPA: PAS domain S-box protein [Burkholderiales bacterium]|nr:PAS domain S-box protein [Burkholderiales bacterium]
MIDPHIYQLIVEQTKDYAVFFLDLEGRVMSWNAGAQRIKGYAPEEIIGRHFSTFYTREAVDSGWPQHELKVAGAEGRFEDEGWRVRKDGSRFWANVVITALRNEDGKLLGFSKITRDLTDRRMHEEALRQSEERFRLLIEGVRDYAIYMLDPEGVITSWNAGAERIKGYRREEILGKHFSAFYVPDDIAAGRPWEELATARRSGRCESEGWRVKKNGDRFWAKTVMTALYDSDGHQRGFAKVTQDLSDRRHIQDLEKASQNVNEFIAMLAHELRNPLAPIRNAVHIMAQVPSGDPAHKAMRETIDRQSAQLSRIVEDMIDIARITRGALVIEHKQLDLADVVRHAVETSTPAIEAGRHTLELDMPAQELPVAGDLHRLAQVLSNILNNAARYTPPGGNIAVRARAEDDKIVVRVRDTGRGIEPEMLDRIFDMFVQGRAPLQRVGGGLGIGLALARRIAELHGGTVEAHSDGVDRGSEFTLSMPRAAPAQPARPQDERKAVRRPAVARRVMVVDDNADAASMLDLLLRSLGHETRVAHDGTEALKLAEEFRPDVVLLDIGMPGLDGYEVARRLRRLSASRPLRIVAVTGWGQDADRQRSREAGFDLHLVKPVDTTELLQALNGRNGATLH